VTTHGGRVFLLRHGDGRWEVVSMKLRMHYGRRTVISLGMVTSFELDEGGARTQGVVAPVVLEPLAGRLQAGRMPIPVSIRARGTS
jgi:hypothetical protein